MEKLNNKEFKKIVETLNGRYDQYLNEKTPEKYRDLVTDKYAWVDETKDITWRGKDGVVELGSQWIEAGVSNETITVEEVENYGNVGWQIAKIEIDWPNEQGVLEPLEGRFVEIFEKESDGNWRTRLQFFVPKR